MASGGRKTTCDLCCHETSAWAVGPCDHTSCLACSARLRVLCEMKECPVCREELEKVVITENPRPFLTISIAGLRSDRKYGFIFESPLLYDMYRTLRDSRCNQCHDVFRSFSQLRDHARKVHDMVYCDICVEHLKLFPAEFRMYSRPDLTRHRRDGDPDDRSHKGHPMCKFCDERYLDNDALHSHLRKVHFWCHICENDGKQEYYANYILLRQHFKKDHYLCEEGPCRHEKLTSVYRTKIDLQAHRAATHTKGLSKTEAKQLRQLDVGFTFSRPSAEDVGYEYVPVGRGSRGRTRAQTKEREDIELATALSVSTTQSSEKKDKKQKSPVTERGGSKPPLGRNSPPHVNTKQTGNNHTDLSQDIGSRKPPGFETVSTPSGGETEWPDLSEWPDLLGNDPPKGNPYSYSTVSAPPPGFAYVPVTANKPTQAVQPPTATRPPGLFQPPTATKPGLFQPPMATKPGLFQVQKEIPHRNAGRTQPRKALESEVIEKVRGIFNYDRSKFTQFVTLSGWYKNGEISVQEYAVQCHSLMGEAWNEVGPELAQVLPDKTKRRELSSLFRASGNTKSKRSKSKMAAGVWQRGGNGMNSSLLNEEEYPSLGTNVTMKHQDPSRVVDPWNMKVYA